jgi:hypothetical protein
MTATTDLSMSQRATLRLLFRMRRHSGGAGRAECMRAAQALHLPCLMSLRAVLRSVI